MHPTVRFAVAALLAAAPAGPALAMHRFGTLALSPDGTHLATIEHDTGASASPALIVTDVATGLRRPLALPCGAAFDCVPSDPVWRPDGSLALLLASPDGTTSIEAADPRTLHLARLARFDGPLDGLAASDRGQLAVLATAHAHKKTGATAAGRRLEGVVGTDIDEQRIAILDGARLRPVSPADLYVYEFAWTRDGRGFVGNASHGDGDSNWWISRLYRFPADGGSARLLFAPGPREQLANPVMSPDGRSLAFVGGWMSDFGSTGGDAFLLDLTAPGATPRNLTAGERLSVTALDWTAAGLLATGIEGGTTFVRRLDPGPATLLWSGTVGLSSDGENQSVDCVASRCAAVRQGFATPPEPVVADRGTDGALAAWRPVAHAPSAATPAPAFTARSITWRNDGQTVQGWLLVPDRPATSPGGRRPLVLDVHGGPEAAASPMFAGDGAVHALLDAGFAVLMPNYRGSFGQGEPFAQGSIHDVGGADWRDVLSGVDAAERETSIDDRRVGIMGGSYGGYMAMQAVASSRRFNAAVAIAGVSDWLSIEGEAPESGADATNFGASVYDDPQPYLRASPIMHIRGATTPTLILVGDRDVECPMPQSQEFAAALAALGVRHEFVVYRDEGHSLSAQPGDRDDVIRRTVAWLETAPPRP